MIIDENVKTETEGLLNRLTNVALDVKPPVIELPSPGLDAVISIPPLDKLRSVNDPNTPLPSIESTIVLYEEVAPTIRVELIVVPPDKVISAVPNVSPVVRFDKSREPASEVKTEFEISVSPAS